MKLNTLAPATGSKPTKTRVGRGIGCGLGKTSGKGHKGQKARSGGYHKRGFEGGQMPLNMRVPKFGFKSRISTVTDQVRTSTLDKLNLEDGAEITLDTLKEHKVVKDTTKHVKIIAHGDLNKNFTVKGLRVTKGAKSQIETAGGKVAE